MDTVHLLADVPDVPLDGPLGSRNIHLPYGFVRTHPLPTFPSAYHLLVPVSSLSCLHLSAPAFPLWQLLLFIFLSRCLVQPRCFYILHFKSHLTVVW